MREKGLHMGEGGRGSSSTTYFLMSGGKRKKVDGEKHI